VTTLFTVAAAFRGGYLRVRLQIMEAGLIGAMLVVSFLLLDQVPHLWLHGYGTYCTVTPSQQQTGFDFVRNGKGVFMPKSFLKGGRVIDPSNELDKMAD